MLFIELENNVFLIMVNLENYRKTHRILNKTQISQKTEKNPLQANKQKTGFVCDWLRLRVGGGGRRRARHDQVQV